MDFPKGMTMGLWAGACRQYVTERSTCCSTSNALEVLWQLLVLMLIGMGFLLKKNWHRAKAFLLSFLNFEVVLVVEVRPTHRLSIPTRSSVQPRLIALQLCLELWDVISVKLPASALHSLQRPSHVAVISVP